MNKEQPWTGRLRFKQHLLILEGFFLFTGLQWVVHAAFFSKLDKLVGLGLYAALPVVEVIEIRRDYSRSKPLAPKHDKDIKPMVAEAATRLGLNADTIEIRFLEGLGNTTYAQAQGALFYGKDKLYISPSFLDLPPASKRAILPHELCHIKYKDRLSSALSYGAIALIGIGGLRLLGYGLARGSTHLASRFLEPAKHSVVQRVANIVHSSFSSLTISWMVLFAPHSVEQVRDDKGDMQVKKPLWHTYGRYGTAWVSRKIEERADREGARATGTAADAIALLESKGTSPFVPTLLDKHPSVQERIEYLRPLVCSDRRHAKE